MISVLMGLAGIWHPFMKLLVSESVKIPSVRVLFNRLEGQGDQVGIFITLLSHRMSSVSPIIPLAKFPLTPNPKP